MSDPFDIVEVNDVLGGSPAAHLMRAWDSQLGARLKSEARKRNAVQKKLELTQMVLADIRVEREQAVAAKDAEIARLSRDLQHLNSQLSEAKRLSGVAVAIAWGGALLLALGVNLLTNDPHSGLAVLLIVIAVVAEGLAFAVRGRGSSS